MGKRRDEKGLYKRKKMRKDWMRKRRYEKGLDLKKYNYK